MPPVNAPTIPEAMNDPAHEAAEPSPVDDTNPTTSTTVISAVPMTKPHSAARPMAPNVPDQAS
jgi:hypothetical protein